MTLLQESFIFWCTSPDCLESLICYESEADLQDHVGASHTTMRATGHGITPCINESTIQHDFERNGFCYVRNVLSSMGVRSFTNQLRDELKKSASEGTYDRTAPPLELHDHSTWPRKGSRRVIECAPVSEGPHWDEILASRNLKNVLDALLGKDAWILPRNKTPENSGQMIRHWYCPVVYPERGSEMPTEVNDSDEVHDVANCGKDSRRKHEVMHNANRLRPMLLCSWKDEVKANGEMHNCEAWWRWQPTNRRRVCGKGWHVDIGPGFDVRWNRTLEGHPYQGVIVLVLLSDWTPGSGGTVMATGSHDWVKLQLEGAGQKGMPHDELNQLCIDHMLRLGYEDRIWIPLDSTLPPTKSISRRSVPRSEGLSVTHSSQAVLVPPPCETGDGHGYILHQICGRAGDALIMHPWMIHCGTTNCSGKPRLMANGMVRVKEEVFQTTGNRVLRSFNR